jgi:hypothetical protein
MAIVSVTELREYMNGISFNAFQVRAAQLVLDGTQEALELYLNRPVQPLHARERRCTNGLGDLPLSVTPVHDVLSLTPTGGSATPLEATLTPLASDDADRVWDSLPLHYSVVPGGLHLGVSGVWYDIEYIGGYNGYANNSLKQAILEVASRSMTVNHDDTLSIKDDIAREPANAGSMVKGWTEEELVRFDRIRRRVVIR